MPPDRTERARPASTTAAIVTATIGLVAAGLFAALTITGGASSSPEIAVRRLFAAVTAGDAVGAIETLAPSERDLLRGPVRDLAGELERLGLLTAFDLGRVPGAAVSTDSLRFRTERLAAGVVAVDVVGGRISAKTDAGALPLAATARDQLARDFGVEVVSGTFTRDFAQHPLRLVTLDEHGGWHVSIAYSVAESWRATTPVYRPRAPHVATTEAPRPLPAFGAGPRPTGATTPEAAVRKLVQALVDRDASAAVALLVPGESQVLADYLPLLPAGAPPGSGSAVENLNVTVAGDGSVRTATITALEADLVGTVQNTHVSYTGRCLRVDYRFGDRPPYAFFTRCNGEATAPGATETEAQREAREREELAASRARSGDGAPEDRSANPMPRDNPFTALAVFGGGADFPTFSIVERDGRWYVSPVRSIGDSMVATLRAMDPGQVGGLTERLRRSVLPDPNTELLAEARDPDNGLFGPKAVSESPLTAQCFLDVMATVGDYGVSRYGPDCLRNLVDTGKVGEHDIAPIVLFGDCLRSTHEGPPDASNPYRRLYLVDRAIRSCLQRHVDAGDASPEILGRVDDPASQACYLAYQRLAPTDPEPAWAAADTEAEACVATLLTPPAPPPPPPPPPEL